ncbi:MAG: hypothetical protein ABMA01_22610, partial [Chthoniobacteraceae bacterium]
MPILPIRLPNQSFFTSAVAIAVLLGFLPIAAPAEPEKGEPAPVAPIIGAEPAGAEPQAARA